MPRASCASNSGAPERRPVTTSPPMVPMHRLASRVAAFADDMIFDSFGSEFEATAISAIDARRRPCGRRRNGSTQMYDAAYFRTPSVIASSPMRSGTVPSAIDWPRWPMNSMAKREIYAGKGLAPSVSAFNGLRADLPRPRIAQAGADRPDDVSWTCMKRVLKRSSHLAVMPALVAGVRSHAPMRSSRT